MSVHIKQPRASISLIKERKGYLKTALIKKIHLPRSFLSEDKVFDDEKAPMIFLRTPSNKML